jgi:hypothetical protein
MSGVVVLCDEVFVNVGDVIVCIESLLLLDEPLYLLVGIVGNKSDM